MEHTTTFWLLIAIFNYGLRSNAPMPLRSRKGASRAAELDIRHLGLDFVDETYISVKKFLYLIFAN